MLNQVLTLKFLFELLALFFVGVLVCLAAKRYYKDVTSRDIHLSFFSTPVSNALLILTLLIPTLIALATTLYKDRPDASYSTLLAAITVFIVVLVIASWLTFSLLKKGAASEKVELKLPDDLHYIAAMGLMYVFLLTGILYASAYFLFELPQPGHKKGVSTVSVLLERVPLSMGLSRSDVEKLWGEPMVYSSATKRYEYRSATSVITLEFDKDWKLMKMQEVRKEF